MDSNATASRNATATRASQQAEQSTTQHVNSMISDIDRLVKGYPYIRHTLPNLRSGIAGLSQLLHTLRSLKNDQYATIKELQQRSETYEVEIAKLKTLCEDTKNSRVRAIAYAHELELKVERHESTIQAAQKNVDEMEEQVWQLGRVVREKDEDAKKQYAELKDLMHRNNNQAMMLKAKAKTGAENNETIRKLEERIDAYEAAERVFEERLEQDYKETWRYHEAEVDGFQDTIDEKDKEFASLKSIIDVQKYEAGGNEEEIEHLRSEIKDLRDQVADKASEIEDLVEEVADLEESLTLAKGEYQDEIIDLKREIRKWEQKSEEAIQAIDDLMKKSESQAGVINATSAFVNMKCAEIEGLKLEMAEKDSKIRIAQSTIQNLADDYDDLVEKTTIREEELKIKIKQLEGSNASPNLSDSGHDTGSASPSPIHSNLSTDSNNSEQAGSCPEAAIDVSSETDESEDESTESESESQSNHNPITPLHVHADVIDIFDDSKLDQEIENMLRSSRNSREFEALLTGFRTNSNASNAFNDANAAQADLGSDLEDFDDTQSNRGCVLIDLTSPLSCASLSPAKWPESETESETAPLSKIPVYSTFRCFGDDEEDEEIQTHISETDNEDDGDEQSEQGSTPSHDLGTQEESYDSDCLTQSNKLGSQSSKKRNRYDVDEESEEVYRGREVKRTRYTQGQVSAAELLKRGATS